MYIIWLQIKNFAPLCLGVFPVPISCSLAASLVLSKFRGGLVTSEPLSLHDLQRSNGGRITFVVLSVSMTCALCFAIN